MKWHVGLVAPAVVGALALSAVSIGSYAWSAPKGVLKALDPNHDGAVDLGEVKAAAAKAFDRLDRDRDGTLDRREVQGRIAKTDFAAADPDKDGTLTRDEYFAVVEMRFKAADPNNDGTLELKELRSRAGRALVRLLR